MVEAGVIDKKTGRDVGLVKAGLVEVGMSILAVTAHLQMIVIRDKGPGSTLDKTQVHETK